ncbi:unnamed protein product [Clonostachys byssicola]|uniref:SNF2 N-terminal domain-containing protein n=1 Tax=Clonostachys byssicola TaxID=160290 RepID=A0A9N9XUL1_9HYPO|nr:unnamed protein product [Clonostachys byssicola]
MPTLEEITKEASQAVDECVRECQRYFARAPGDRIKILEAILKKHELRRRYPPGYHFQHFDTDSAHKEHIRAVLEGSDSEDGPVDDARNDPLNESLRTLVNYTYGPLHSQLLKIAAVIIDESHLAKRLDSQLNEGIRSLPYLHAILLTGTPIYNTWRDQCGQLALLTGCRAFRINETEFRDIAGDIIDDPQSPGCLFMKRLLAGAMIARPLDVIKLPPTEVHKVSFGFDCHRFILIVIETHVSRGRKLLPKAAQPRNRAIQDQLKAQPFGHLTRVQQYAACPVVLKAQDCMDRQTQMDELTRDEFLEFRQDCRDPSRLKLVIPAASRRGSPDDESENGLFLRNDNHFNDDHINEQDMVNIAAQESLDEGFIYADDQNDEIYDPEIGDVELVDEIEYEQGTLDDEGKKTGPQERRQTTSNYAFTIQWKRKLNTFPDIEIFTPRVQAVVPTVKRIADEFLGEGMVIASSPLLFLDVIQEASDRLTREDEVLQFKLSEFNGTVDIDQRATTISEFNESDNHTRALLVTAGVGGFIGRVRRIPQRRKNVVKKKQVITMLEKHLVRKDTQVIIQERQPDSTGLGQFLLNGEKHNS